MEIREARSEDAALLAELGATVQKVHHEQNPEWFKTANAAETVSVYEEFLKSPDTTAYLAQDDSGVIGFVTAKVIHQPETALGRPRTVVYIDQIGVAPFARRRGAGHELMNAVRALADQVSASRLVLTTWEFNTDAHRFFEYEGLATELRRMAMAWPATA
jgi:ribosomal protein S18 acetylase RimI-like enzyme